MITYKEPNVPRLSTIRKRALDEMMKEALFGAAVGVLTRHGVDGMTMDRVAQAAGVAKGSLYTYFHGKKELLEFVYTRTVGPLLCGLAEIVTSQCSAVEKLSAYVRMLLEHVAANLELFRCLFEDDAAQGLLQSSQRANRAVFCKSLAQVMCQGMDEGTFRSGDPLILANMFIGLCRGVFDGRPKLEQVAERDQTHGLIIETFLHGVAGTRRF
jgi:AcrR family transcriptional regulator